MSGYQTKAELAFRALKRGIRNGELKPGEPIPQRVLAARLGMSLTPVREAIRRLEAEGYLRGEAHRTPRVKDLTLREVREIYAIRAVIEEFATLQAAASLEPADMAKLTELVDLMAEACRRRQFRRYRALDEQFHMMIYTRSANRLLIDLIEDSWSRYPRDVLWTIPGRIERSLEEHGRIVEALNEGDSLRASALMRAHILNSMNEVVDFLSVESTVTLDRGKLSASRRNRGTISSD